MFKSIQSGMVIFLSSILVFFPGIPVYAEELNLAVANSTCNAIKRVGSLFEKQHQIRINYICKSSGRLAKGLHGGSINADIYISANRKWMDYMLDNKLVIPDQVSSTWGNQLVVATRKDSELKINQWDELALEKVGTILIGDPGTAPFGRYAKEALQSTGLWSRIRNKIETKKHITLLADTLAESDKDTIGILFFSNTTDKLRTIYLVDASWHSPIRYFMAPVRTTAVKKQVAALLEFIQNSSAQEIFLEEGFLLNTP